MRQSLSPSRIGFRVLSATRFAGGFAQLTWQTAVEAVRFPVPFKLIVQQAYAIGVESLLLVLITGLATGSVMAL
ncbi:MAG: hypothetical protein EBX52_09675, partial [Proteobacteria bacterium]|nr:hypothetical protein [Pseudomonadota bacterium]